MAKNHLNKKELRRLKQKDAFAQATEVRLLAERLPNQAALDTMLLPVENIDRRKMMFEFMKPFLKFPNPQLPTTIQTPGIVRP